MRAFRVLRRLSCFASSRHCSICASLSKPNCTEGLLVVWASAGVFSSDLISTFSSASDSGSGFFSSDFFSVASIVVFSSTGASTGAVGSEPSGSAVIASALGSSFFSPSLMRNPFFFFHSSDNSPRTSSCNSPKVFSNSFAVFIWEFMSSSPR